MRAADLHPSSVVENLAAALSEGPVILTAPPRLGRREIAQSALAKLTSRPPLVIDPSRSGTHAALTADLAGQLVSHVVGRPGPPRGLRPHELGVLQRTVGSSAPALVATANNQPGRMSFDEVLRTVAPTLPILILDASELQRRWAANVLWALRGRAGDSPAPAMLLLTRPHHRLDDPDEAFLGAAQIVALTRPPDEHLAHELARAGVPADHVGGWLARSRSLPAIIAAMYEHAGKDGDAGWLALTTAAARALPYTRRIALQAHQLGPGLLEAIARDQPPYSSIPGAAPALVANALAALRDADLVSQPAPRRWELCDPAVREAMLAGPWDRRSSVERPLRPQPGPLISPEDTVGRAATTARARRELLDGNNLILTAPRRMGKTAWLGLLAAEPGDGLRAITIDVEGIATTTEFVARMIDAVVRDGELSTRAARTVRALSAGLKTADPVGELARPPAELLEEAFKVVDAQIDEETLLVLAIDELPIAIGAIARAEGQAAAGRLMRALRHLRLGSVRLRWILSGESGLRRILRRADAAEGTINDLVALPFGPLDREDARVLTRRLMLGIQRPADDDAVAALVEQSGGVAFLIHAIAHRLLDGAGPVAADEVNDAFSELIDDEPTRRDVAGFFMPLESQYHDDLEAAEAILDRVAIDGSTKRSALDVESRLLDDLIDDAYLVERDGTVQWRYDVFRRIWAHRRTLAVAPGR